VLDVCTSRAAESRVPPNDQDAEGAVLSAVMIHDGRAGFDEVADVLRPEHFYSEAHRRIFAACEALVVAGKPCDVVTVATWLREHDRLAQVGGMAYLTEVVNAAPALANLRDYAEIVGGKWRARQVILTCQKFAAHGYIPHGDEREFATEAAQALAEIATSDTKRSLVGIGETIGDNMRALLAAAKSGQTMLGRPTGLRRYDRLTSGLHDGELTIVAARPGMGKTALVLNMAVSVAGGVDVKPSADPEPEVAIFSLEMPREQLVNRMLCTEARVSFSNLRTGMATPMDWSKLTQASANIAKLGIAIDDTPAIDPVELRAKVRRHATECAKRKRRLRLVAVDYLQLMRGRAHTSSREQEVADISRSLKALAKEMGIPVIALSQLNRKLEERGDKRPILSDLRESGAIEQDADNVVFIHREGYFKKDSPDRNIAELIVAKQRNGPTDTVKVQWSGDYTRFDDLDDCEAGGRWHDDRD
jgi:replicative DNA helicase